MLSGGMVATKSTLLYFIRIDKTVLLCQVKEAEDFGEKKPNILTVHHPII
jgi:hypothetical protein